MLLYFFCAFKAKKLTHFLLKTQPNKGFIEFIVSPSLEVCGDVLDRIHQINETPAKQLVAPAVSPQPQQISASATAIRTKDDCDHETEVQVAVPTSTTSSAHESTPPTPATAIGPPTQTTFATTSEALTSNLRKIIVSSSATISRKLNISSQNSSKQAPPHPPPPQSHTSQSGSEKSALPQPQPQQSQAQLQSQQSASTDKATADNKNDASADRDDRAASYKHPVIKPNTRDASSAPPTSSSSSTQRQQLASNSIQPFKVKRPWIACLEANKKLWQERATQGKSRRNDIPFVCYNAS